MEKLIWFQIKNQAKHTSSSRITFKIQVPGIERTRAQQGKKKWTYMLSQNLVCVLGLSWFLRCRNHRWTFLTSQSSCLERPSRWRESGLCGQGMTSHSSGSISEQTSTSPHHSIWMLQKWREERFERILGWNVVVSSAWLAFSQQWNVSVRQRWANTLTGGLQYV